MAQKPFLFLDVDGVLNCFDESKGTWINEGADRACVPPDMDLRIELLAQSFEIVWATAWFGSAHAAFGEHLRLPNEPWDYLRWNQYKLTEIVKYAKGRPWAWADDDIDFELKWLGWNEDTHLPDDTFLLRVNPNVGLTNADTHDLLKFAYDVTPVAPDPTEFIA
jgi:hypothetical protein